MQTLTRLHRGSLDKVNRTLLAIDKTDLELYYPIWENGGTTLYDESKAGGNGTINGATWEWDATYSKPRLSFDGVDDYVDGIPNPNYSVGTIILIFSTAATAGEVRARFYQGNDPPDGKDAFTMQSWDDGNSYWGWLVNGTDYRYVTPDAFPSGVWMATIRWDGGTGDRDVYWNKTLKDSITNHGDPGGRLEYVPYLGAGNNPGGNYYYADMDAYYFFHYSRFLPESEIFAIYDKILG